MTDPALKVRVGTPADVHDVMELALMGADENGFVRPSQTKILAEVWAGLTLNDGIMGLIGPEGGKPEGAILIRIGSDWYTEEKVLIERGVFVHPDHRSAKGGRAARLCEFGKAVSDGLGIPLTIGIMSNHRTEGKVGLYRRQFGPPAGAYWLYNAETGVTNKGAPGESVLNNHQSPAEKPLPETVAPTENKQHAGGAAKVVAES